MKGLQNFALAARADFFVHFLEESKTRKKNLLRLNDL